MLLLRLQIRSADKLSNKSPVGRLCRPSRDRLWQTQAPRKEMSSQAAAMPRKILKTLIDHSQATAAWNPISLRNDYPISCTVRPINIFYCHPTTGRQWQSRGNIIYCPTQRARALNWIGEERENFHFHLGFRVAQDLWTDPGWCPRYRSGDLPKVFDSDCYSLLILEN